MANEAAANAGGVIPQGDQFAGGFNALKPATDVIKKLNPLETTLPWAAKAIGESQGLVSAGSSPEQTGPTKGTELSPVLSDIMEELRATLAK
jgi:hypothetical protein